MTAPRFSYRHLFLIPSAVARPPAWLKATERSLERVPVLGAGVGILLARRPG